jgi:recombination protein RecA
MSSLAVISTQVETLLKGRVPAAFMRHSRPQLHMIPTCIPALDEVTGGIPISALTTIVANPQVSSGRTSLLQSILASATAHQSCCALIDATDCFDPYSAQTNGVSLSSLLWIRCRVRSSTKLTALEQAFKAADLVLQSGGFGLIVLDLSGVAATQVQRIPLTTWFRFQRVVEKAPTAFVVFTPVPCANSCTELAIQLGSADVEWKGGVLPHAILLKELRANFTIARNRSTAKKPPQSHQGYSAKARQA